MGDTQRQAVKDYRARLKGRGLSRFEVIGRPSDRSLIRTLAHRLASGTAQAEHLRATIRMAVSEGSAKGGILAALRASPLVGADLALERDHESGRDVTL